MNAAASRAEASVAAVVVTYEPDIDALVQMLSETSRQVVGIVVVDNGSKSQSSIAQYLEPLPKVALVKLADNLGIAAALTLGYAVSPLRGTHIPGCLPLTRTPCCIQARSIPFSGPSNSSMSPRARAALWWDCATNQSRRYRCPGDGLFGAIEIPPSAMDFGRCDFSSPAATR